MSKSSDIRCKGVALHFLPVETRVPLKFGKETLTHVTCARVRVRVENATGKSAEGWGETPLSVTWVWPSSISYEEREEVLKELCCRLAKAWAEFYVIGHAIEIGHAFIETRLHDILSDLNRERRGKESMPWLAALVCCSAFDIAVHDAYGILNEQPVYATYNNAFMNTDLSHFLEADESGNVSFRGKYPEDYFKIPQPETLAAWHLVGGLDPLDRTELTGSEPDDGYPILLEDWIERDGLTCLKVKLRGNDAAWDYERLVRVGKIAQHKGVKWLTADFNCTVTEPAYVNEILDRLAQEYPAIYETILYVEQPFPYDLEENRIDVHTVSERKPLFMDESAHDWRLVRLGRTLGWTGVALKTCKTQTGALLSLCWAKAHGMDLMVQDLTNPMLAQIPHVLLAAHAGTIKGVETNSMQFYPEASLPEQEVHPGLYQRRGGCVNLSTISGAGFGYRVDEIKRTLPKPEIEEGE
jgi:L-alanine-DL-glutamate epimerase-like enolase superfamily enzyme